jgi:cell fate regulator YaaT (PSP1 superfamily)
MTDSMIKIAGVRFRENWKVYDFDATNIDVVVGDKVIVDSDRGAGFAQVVRLKKAMMPLPAPEEKPVEQEEEIELPIDGKEEIVPENPPDAPAARPAPRGLRRVLRKATEDDLARQAKNETREAEAFTVAQDMITERELQMKLIRVEYSFDASRATFFFFSETRVDFRELVKDLAYKLKSRIEMRQIGVRDVARMIGGFGPCGRELCCSAFLKNFEPVSIRMAKKQDMVLNPAKISGVCGRLLCCLSYEYEMYDEIKKDLAGMRDSAVREKREEEERRIAEERKDAEERRMIEEKRRQEERRQQPEQRREKQREGGQKSGRPDRPDRKKERPDRKKEQPQEKKPQPAKEQPRRQQQQPKAEKQPLPDKQQAPEQKPQQPAQDGEAAAKKKRRRFWRRKKKGPQQGENKPPQGPAGG